MKAKLVKESLNEFIEELNSLQNNYMNQFIEFVDDHIDTDSQANDVTEEGLVMHAKIIADELGLSDKDLFSVYLVIPEFYRKYILTAFFEDEN